MTDDRLRRRVEGASSAPLERLGRFRLLLPLLVGVAVPVALLVDAVWATVLGVAALLVLAWVAYLSWPGLPGGARAVRIVVLAALAVLLLVG